MKLTKTRTGYTAMEGRFVIQPELGLNMRTGTIVRTGWTVLDRTGANPVRGFKNLTAVRTVVGAWSR